MDRILNLVIFCCAQIEHDELITDRMFKFIETNPQAMAMYSDIRQAIGSKALNRGIGKLIKSTYGLKNLGRAAASSSLINTFTRH